MGIEPMTSSLPRKRSTPELHRLYTKRSRQTELRVDLITSLALKSFLFRMTGAGDEARTRDLQLGRLSLYQLSYSRLLLISFKLE